MTITTHSPLRVLLADDQRSIRISLRGLCQALTRVEVVGEAKDGQQAVDMTDLLTPDMVLMDVQMPTLDGLQATRQIMQHHPETAIIILSAYAEYDMVREALKVGARGYIRKDELTETRLTHAVQVVEAGGLFFDTRTGTGLLHSFYAE